MHCLRRFKATQAIKGFAFIEFDSPEAADKALEAYGVQKDNKPSLEPEELQTIKSFNQEQEAEAKDEANNVSTEVKKENDETSESKPDDAKANPEQDEEKAKTTKKKNRRHKQRNGDNGFKHVPEHALQQHQQPLPNLAAVTVMSKTQWRRLRNTYLNLQRKNLSQDKKRLQKWKAEEAKSAKEQEDKNAEGEEAEQNMEEEEEAKPTMKEIQFVPSTIVRFSLAEPVEDKQMLKKRVSAAFLEPVSYVDASIGASEYHVRCANAEQAAKLARVASLGSESKVLEGEEEETYWRKLRADREQKRSKKRPNEGGGGEGSARLEPD